MKSEQDRGLFHRCLCSRSTLRATRLSPTKIGGIRSDQSLGRCNVLALLSGRKLIECYITSSQNELGRTLSNDRSQNLRTRAKTSKGNRKEIQRTLNAGDLDELLQKTGSLGTHRSIQTVLKLLPSCIELRFLNRSIPTLPPARSRTGRRSDKNMPILTIPLGKRSIHCPSSVITAPNLTNTEGLLGISKVLGVITRKSIRTVNALSLVQFHRSSLLNPLQTNLILIFLIPRSQLIQVLLAPEVVFLSRSPINSSQVTRLVLQPRLNRCLRSINPLNDRLGIVLIKILTTALELFNDLTRLISLAQLRSITSTLQDSLKSGIVEIFALLRPNLIPRLRPRDNRPFTSLLAKKTKILSFQRAKGGRLIERESRIIGRGILRLNKITSSIQNVEPLQLGHQGRVLRGNSLNVLPVCLVNLTNEVNIKIGPTRRKLLGAEFSDKNFQSLASLRVIRSLSRSINNLLSPDAGLLLSIEVSQSLPMHSKSIRLFLGKLLLSYSVSDRIASSAIPRIINTSLRRERPRSHTLQM